MFSHKSGHSVDQGSIVHMWHGMHEVMVTGDMYKYIVSQDSLAVNLYVKGGLNAQPWDIILLVNDDDKDARSFMVYDSYYNEGSKITRVSLINVPDWVDIVIKDKFRRNPPKVAYVSKLSPNK